MINGRAAEKVRDRLVELIRDYTEKAGVKRIVLGVSGGKDSSVAAALSARAVGKENVYGILLPAGTQRDIADSEEVIRALGINGRTVNIGAAHDALKGAVLLSLSEDFFPAAVLQEEGDAAEARAALEKAEHESDINSFPRIRMTALRYIAQALGAFLCGTGNASERYVGYCTKDGDTSCDFNPLGALTSIEVVELGLTMPELPVHLVKKTPDDGLSGIPDEVKLGVSYQAIHDVIRNGTSGDPVKDALIERKYRASAHKRALPPILDPFA